MNVDIEQEWKEEMLHLWFVEDRVDPRHASKTTISNRRTTFGQCDLLRITPPFAKQFHGCRHFRKVRIGSEEDEDAFGGSFIAF